MAPQPVVRAGLQAIEVAQREHPEVVLLDIRMPGMDGLEAARHLASLEEPPAVIFCTAYEEHAIEAFEVQAVGYLLKPVRSEKLAEAMASGQRLNKAQLLALSQPAGSRRTHISARTRRGIELVPIEDVRYFQADQKYVTVLHIGGELIIDEPLRELEDEFGEMFLRVHRNALVAVRHIEGLERGTDGHYRIRLRGADASLDISRRHVAAVRRLVKRL
jgi:two-component system response regulator AlgR